MMTELLMSFHCLVDNKLCGVIIGRILMERQMYQQNRNRIESEV